MRMRFTFVECVAIGPAGRESRRNRKFYPSRQPVGREALGTAGIAAEHRQIAAPSAAFSAKPSVLPFRSSRDASLRAALPPSNSANPALEIIMSANESSATRSERLESASETSGAVDRRNFLKAAGITVAAGGVGSSLLPLGSTPAMRPSRRPRRRPAPTSCRRSATRSTRSSRTSTPRRWRSITTSITRPTSTTSTSPSPAPSSAISRSNELIANLDQVPENIRTAVQNNGGGHANHTLFWQLLKKNGGKPGPELAKAIDSQLGGFDKFKADSRQGRRRRASAAAGPG